MKNTPRTDEAVSHLRSNVLEVSSGARSLLFLCQELEQELNEANAKLEAIHKAITDNLCV